MTEETTNQSTLDDFLNEVETQVSSHRETYGTGEIVDRETLKAERDQLYEGYILEGYSHDVQGQYGKNTAVRLTAPDGAKVTLWVNGFEEEHFKTFVATRVEQAGHQLPVKVSFLRTQRTAEKTGRTYNKIQFRLDAAGEDVQFELESL